MLSISVRKVIYSLILHVPSLPIDAVLPVVVNHSSLLFQLLGLFLVVHPSSPPLSINGGQDYHARTEQQEATADRAEPANSNLLNCRQYHGRSSCGEQVPDHVVARYNLRRPSFCLHNVQAIRVETGKAEQLRHSLDEHCQHRQRDSANSLVDAPAVDNNAAWYDDSHRHYAALQSVFWDTPASFPDPFLDDMVRPSSTKEATEQVSNPRSNIEESRLDRRGEVKTRIEYVSYWRQKRIHVPDKRRRCRAHDDQVWVFEEQDCNAKWIDHMRYLLDPLYSAELSEVINPFGRYRLGQEEDH